MTDQHDPAAPTATHDVVAYRIGWWTHKWWPTQALILGLLTGNQPSRRADNGRRFVGRRRFIAPIVSRLRKIRRPHRPWQAEPVEDPGFWFCCRRALTASGAERKMRADLRHAIEHAELSPWQRRYLARKEIR